MRLVRRARKLWPARARRAAPGVRIPALRAHLATEVALWRAETGMRAWETARAASGLLEALTKDEHQEK